MSLEPEEITVIIHGAKNLHSKKKGKGKFSVIFGIGHNKYTTDVVKDPNGSPTWNQESPITVKNSSHPLKLVVNDRDNVLGQVLVPLQCLQTTKTKPEEAPLRSHKRCNNPHGEIMFQAWISKFHYSDVRDDDVCLIQGGNAQSVSMGALPRKSSALGRLKEKLKNPNSSSDLGSNENLKSQNRKGSLSVLNLSFGRRSSKSKPDQPGRMLRANSSFAVGSNQKFSIFSGSKNDNKAQSCIDLNETGNEPIITEITPNDGPIEGGTTVTIFGENLGYSREDVIGLFIANSNCLETLEYKSPQMLYCTTRAWKPSAGPVVVVTQSGGRGISTDRKARFTFYPHSDEECHSIVGEVYESNNNLNLSQSSEETGYVSDGSKKDKDEKRLSLLSVPGQESKPDKCEKEHKRHDSLHDFLTNALRPSGKTKSSSLTKEDMLEEIQKTRTENQKLTAEVQSLKNKNKNLLIENKDLVEQNKNLKIYIDKLLMRVISECPDVLKVSCSKRSSTV